MFWTGLYLYRSWFTFYQYQTKTIILWYDINDLAKTAYLSLIYFTSALGSKIVFSCKCQQKEWSSGWTVHYFTIGKVSKYWDFTVLWLIQKIDHWLELTNSITFMWLLFASKREQYLAVSVVSTLLPVQSHNQLLLFSKVYLSIRG